MMHVFPPFIRNSLRELITPPNGQVPALDALRSCAILLVLLCHASNAYLHASGQDNLIAALPFVRGGWLGVDLFFVLSGYLIGKQLWRELQRTGTVRLGRFMLRRGLRIWPLYFAVFGFLVLVLGQGQLPFGKGWSDVVFLTNYVPGGVVPGGWSLCTEEQFYLLAPALLLAGAWFSRPLGWYRWPLLGCLVLLPVLRALTWSGVADWFSAYPSAFDRVYRPIHTHADGLIMGLLLSNFSAQGAGPNLRRGASWWCLTAALAAFACSYLWRREIFLFSGAALFFGALTWFLLARPQLSAALFRSRAFYVVSRLSYGMYLNHLLLVAGVLTVGLAVPLDGVAPALHTVLIAGLLIAASLAVSCVSYCLIEYPFLQLRDRVLDRATQKIPETRAAVLAGGVA